VNGVCAGVWIWRRGRDDLGNQKTEQDEERKRQNAKHDEPIARFQGHAGGRVGKKSGGVNHSDVDETLAVQGVLGNLVAGLTIIFTKPFRVGEYIEVAGVSGQVKHIELFSTMLLHSDMSHVMVPNRKLVGEILHNYGHIRQLDLSVGVAYGTNMDSALKIIGDILTATPRVLKDPTPVVGIAALGESSIQIMNQAMDDGCGIESGAD
jgi:small conductance mechanosensitive channel